jgi:hypothetical protein
MASAVADAKPRPLAIPALPPLVVARLTPLQNALLNAFEDFFVSGAVTSRVGAALRQYAASYAYPPEDDSGSSSDDDDDAERPANRGSDFPGAQENFAKFLSFGELIDGLVGEFIAGVDVSQLPRDDSRERAPTSDDLLGDVAEICNALADDDAAAMFVSIPYVAAALEFARFDALVADTQAMACAVLDAAGEEDSDASDGETSRERDGQSAPTNASATAAAAASV